MNPDSNSQLSFRWYWHSQRRRHQMQMAYALAKIEWSEHNAREANRFAVEAKAHPQEVKWKVLANSHVRMGWEDVLEAVGALTECGCPRTLWPEKVRKAVREHE